MSKNTYIPPNVLSAFKQKAGFLLRNKWVRELILLPSTISGKRFSNKTADYGVFEPSLLSHLDQLSIYVKDIGKSQKWYENLVGMTTSRIAEAEPHPFKNGYTVRCCYMSADEHEECLVLIEERNEQGKISVPSGMSFFHFALEVSGNRLEDVKNFEKQGRAKGYTPNYGTVTHNDKPPMGDGETGGNTAVYFYDPDWNNVEFCGTMDTIENYLERRKSNTK